MDGEVEPRWEQRSRATHDYMDIGGTSPGMDEVERSRRPEPRVTPGRLQGCKRLKSYGTGFPAVTEEAKAECTELIFFTLCDLCALDSVS